MNKKINRKTAVSRLRQEAHKRVIKDEVIKFRLESKTLERLLLLAKKLNKPVGTLVREWVITMLNQAENKSITTPELTAIGIITSSLAKHGILHDKQVVHINQLLAQEVKEIETDKFHI